MRDGLKSSWGFVYLPKGRNGKQTRWYKLKYKLPGETTPRRIATNPRTDDRQEAERQLHVLLGEKPRVRRRRESGDDLTVNDLLDLVEWDYADNGREPQPERIIAWRHLLGAQNAVDVSRIDLDAICRRWQQTGVTWREGSHRRRDGTEAQWEARDPERVRPITGATCNRFVAILKRAYKLAKDKYELLTPLTFPGFDERKRGEYFTDAEIEAICENFQTTRGKAIKVAIFRLAALLGPRKGQWLAATKRNVILGENKHVEALRWQGDQTKNAQPHEIDLTGLPEAQELVQWAWDNRLPDCDLLFHVNGKPVGSLRSELKRTCKHLGIPYGRKHGKVFHDTRHTAKTNLTEAGIPDEVAMTITGHKDVKTFRSYHVRRKSSQQRYLRQYGERLAQERAAQNDRS
jgi:hypothetical protein